MGYEVKATRQPRICCHGPSCRVLTEKEKILHTNTDCPASPPAPHYLAYHHRYIGQPRQHYIYNTMSHTHSMYYYRSTTASPLTPFALAPLVPQPSCHELAIGIYSKLQQGLMFLSPCFPTFVLSSCEIRIFEDSEGLGFWCGLLVIDY